MRDNNDLITVPWRRGQTIEEFVAACRQALDAAANASREDQSAMIRSASSASS